MTTHDEFENRPELIRLRARNIFVKRLIIALAVLWVLATTTTTTVNAVFSFSTRSTLLSCTVPGEKCYDEAQRNTGKVVQQIIDSNQLDEVATQNIVIAASYCANTLDNNTEAQIRQCVEDRIKERERQ